MQADQVNLSDSWEQQAQAWIAWARLPGHDTFWRFHRDQFLDLLPVPGCKTVDIGCGEGRLTRHLKGLGHKVVGFDASPTLIAAAQEADPSAEVVVADAALLPLADCSADLAVAFMSLHDVDELPQVMLEIRRILKPGGKLCFAIVHPLNSSGSFQDKTADAPFIIENSYLKSFHYSDMVERGGLKMVFHSRHRPLEEFFAAMEGAGLVVETLREPKIPDSAVKSEADLRWQRLPLFLHIRAVRI